VPDDLLVDRLERFTSEPDDFGFSLVDLELCRGALYVSLEDFPEFGLYPLLFLVGSLSLVVFSGLEKGLSIRLELLSYDRLGSFLGSAFLVFGVGSFLGVPKGTHSVLDFRSDTPDLSLGLTSRSPLKFPSGVTPLSAPTLRSVILR
jgi:hypothetical protein